MDTRWRRIIAGIYESDTRRVQVRDLDDPNCRQWIVLCREHADRDWSPCEYIFDTMREAKSFAEEIDA